MGKYIFSLLLGILSVTSFANTGLSEGNSNWDTEVEVERYCSLNDTFLVKPYLQNVKPNGITIMWETNNNSNAIFKYGISKSNNTAAESVSVKTNANTFIHKVVLDNLEPNTNYSFSVYLSKHTYEQGNFQTAPSSTSHEFSIMVWGDSHHYAPFNKMIEFITDSIHPDIAISTGDISNSGNNRNDLEKVFFPLVCNKLGSSIPFYVSFGNHDVDKRWDGGNLIRQYFDLPYEENTSENVKQKSYLLMYANVAFICVDWETQENDMQDNSYLEKTLRSKRVQNARYKFLFIHNAPFYERWQVAENSTIKTKLPQLAEKYNIQAVFSGHMHAYERGSLNNVQYITQGGASYMDKNEPIGPIIYDHILLGTNKKTNPPSFNNGLHNHFMTIDIKEDKAVVKLHCFTHSGQYLGVMDTIFLMPEI